MEQTNEQNRQAPTPSKGNPFMELLWGLLIVLLLNGLVFPQFSGPNSPTPTTGHSSARWTAVW